MKPYFEILMNNWEFLAPVIYEIIARLWPTKWNVSILDNGWKILNWIIPNLRKKKGNEMMVNEKQNFVPVNINKHILKCLFVLFMFTPLIQADAQIWQNFKGVRLVNQLDSTQVLSVDGSIYYNEQSNKFRAMQNGQWYDIIGGGGGSGDTTYLPFVYPEYWGAVGDGVTNDAAAIQTAIDSGLPVYFSKKTYLVNNTLTVTDNTMIFGSGESSILLTTSNISIISIAGRNNFFINITFTGNDTGAAQRGISIIGDAGFTVDLTGNRLVNCTFSDFGNTGLYVQFARDGVAGAHTNTGPINAVNCTFKSSLYGVWLDTQAEYNNFSNCSSVGNSRGLNWTGGNNTWDGGQITGNGLYAIYLNAGTNDGHGVISNCKINHNANFLNASGITLGFLFSDNMIYANGNMVVVNCVGIRFVNNDFQQGTFITQTNSNTAFTGNRFLTSIPFVISGTAQPTFLNNYFPAGLSTGVGFNTMQGGKLVLLPTPTYSGLNWGAFAGDPSTPTDGDVWYNSSTLTNRQRVNGVTTNFLGGTLTTTRIPFASGAGMLTDEDALKYITANNQILLTNAAGTHTTSIFGGEIQLDDNVNSYDVTINNAGINISGVSDYKINPQDSITVNDANNAIAFDPAIKRIVFRDGTNRVGFIQFNSIDNTFTIGRGGTSMIVLNNNGEFILNGLQTDCTGAASGSLWNDSGTIKVCP